MNLDLKWGYQQIPIESTYVWKMNFKTKEGLFEWLDMPFGLTNAPLNFMRYMDDLIWPLIRKCVIVYLDDILIFSWSWEEHVKQFWQVFETLQQHQLYLNMEKFSFSMTSTNYLGYVIDSVGTHLPRKNIDPQRLAHYSKHSWTKKFSWFGKFLSTVHTWL